MSTYKIYLVAAMLFWIAPFCISQSDVGRVELSDMNSSGNRYLDICGEVLNTPHLTPVGVACMSYISGLSDGIAMFAAKGSIQEMYCSPDGVTIGQVFRILVKYAKDHPEKLNEQPRLLMLPALIQAFPCSTVSTKK